MSRSYVVVRNSPQHNDDVYSREITSLEIVILVTFYHSAASVFLNVLLLTGVFLRYRYITIVT